MPTPKSTGLRTALTTPADVRQFGGPVKSEALTWEVGVVRYSDPVTHRYTVGLAGGDISNIFRISPGPGDIEIIPEDTLVLVCRGIPFGPYIWGVVQRPEDVTPMSVTPAPSVTGSPLLPGDRFMQSPAGSYVGTFASGTCGVYSTDMARIITKPDHSVEMFSGQFRHVSMFGDTEITQSGDKVNYSLRGGASVTAHTGPLKEDAWTLRIDAGSEGDLLDVRVTNALGDTLSQFHFTSSGGIRVKASAGRIEKIDGSDTRVVLGLDRDQVTGDASREVQGKLTEVFGAQDTTVTNNATKMYGSLRTIINRNHSELTTGDHRKQVRGKSVTDYANGFTVAVASPVTATIPAAQAATWINSGGSFNFVVDATAVAGSFNVATTLPGSVNLGVTGTAVFNPATQNYNVMITPGAFSAVLYEQLVLWLTDLMTWLDTHVHATAVGPSSPPAVPVSPLQLPRVTTFQSLRVKYGA